MHTADFWISALDLRPHPEGGFFREVYRSDEQLLRAGLPARYAGTRPSATAMYYLLRDSDVSRLHRLLSDELWFHLGGGRLTIHILRDRPEKVFLGRDVERGESLFRHIPRSTWFGASVDVPGAYVVAACVVSPGFVFEDLEFAGREAILEVFPDLPGEVTRLL